MRVKHVQNKPEIIFYNCKNTICICCQFATQPSISHSFLVLYNCHKNPHKTLLHTSGATLLPGYIIAWVAPSPCVNLSINPLCYLSNSSNLPLNHQYPTHFSSYIENAFEKGYKDPCIQAWEGGWARGWVRGSRFSRTKSSRHHSRHQSRQQNLFIQMIST